MSERPYVTINVAASVDGKIDTVERRGASISSEGDRRRVDVLRAAVDAVMVGGRTLLDEDPRLIVRAADLRAERLARGLPENPAKVGVLTRLSALRLDSRFLSVGPARVIVFTCDSPSDAAAAALVSRGAELYATGEAKVDLVAAMRQLGGLGIGRVLVEGGGSLNFELLRLGLVDELQVFIAPLVFGGAAAPTLADGQGLPRDLALALQRVDVEVWPDGGVLLRYKVVRR